MLNDIIKVWENTTYFNCQHHNGQSSCCVDVRLKVVDHRRVTTLYEKSYKSIINYI